MGADEPGTALEGKVLIMTIIQQILELAGPMPDAEAHARYLETLTTAELQARAAALT